MAIAQLTHREPCQLHLPRQLPSAADTQTLDARRDCQGTSESSYSHHCEDIGLQDLIRRTRGSSLPIDRLTFRAPFQLSQSQLDVNDNPTQSSDSGACVADGPPSLGRISADVCSPRLRSATLFGHSNSISASDPIHSREATAAKTSRSQCSHRLGPRNLSGEAKRWDAWVPTAEFQRCVHVVRRNAMMHPCSYPSGPLLPPKTSVCQARCTLILDLDETLVRAHTSFVVSADTACTFVRGGIVHCVQVNIRPGAAAFLAILAEWFELVAFTASCRVCIFSTPAHAWLWSTS